MLKKIKNIFTGRNKYFVISLFLLLSIIVIGIFSPILIERKSKSWGKELDKNIASIKTSVAQLLSDKQKNLLDKSHQVKRIIKPYLDNKSKLNTVFERLNSKKYYGYSIELIDKNEELIAWTNDIAISGKDFIPLVFEPGEVFFYRSKLSTYLSVIDTCSDGEKLFYFSVSQPVEKHFEIKNNYYERINLTEDLSKKYLTEVEINYSQFADTSKDGRKFSLEVLNNKGHKIGVIEFNKPALDTRINLLNENISDIQGSIAIASVLFLFFGFWKDYKRINSGIIKFILLSIALAAFRYLLYKLNFPANIIESPLTNSSYFASSFGGGIVKSPMELFITVILLFAASVSFYKLCVDYLRDNKNRNKRKFISSILITLAGVFCYFPFLRGLGASLRSVIFDSSLRYFKEVGLLPNLPAGLMQLNVLILGTASVLVATAIIVAIIDFIPADKSNHKKIRWLLLFLFVLFQVAGFLYDHFQADPQGNHLIRFLFISFTFLLAYKAVTEEYSNVYNYVYAALAASIITISLLNYYNTKLERESLKTTAFELTRTNESWLEFLVTQTLVNSSSMKETYMVLKDQLANYEAASFIIWSQSLLQKEKLNSSVTLLNKRKELLGSFGIDLDEKYRINPLALKYEGDGIQIYNNYKPPQTGGKIISGILPIKEDGVLLGYIVVSILFDETNYGRIDYPKVLSPNFSSLNSTVDFEKLKVFDIKGKELQNVFGEITPPDEIIKKITDAQYTNSETWLKVNIDNDDYVTYALKYNRNKIQRIIAVALMENNLSWSMYNFLKAFFIHMIFIIGFLAFVFMRQLSKAKNIRYSFRIQLLGAFLFISLFPLLLLAFYNRGLSEEKNNEATLNNLKEKAVTTERYLQNNLKGSASKNLYDVCEKAATELNINFSLFKGKTLQFSSKNEFYEAGILSEYLNSVVYSKFRFRGVKEDLIKENIEKYNYNSFYKIINADNTDYILRVDDIFNKVTLPITGEEYDVFLFGSYSVVIILIVLFSAFMANKISSPIRKLTKATASVAEGDLSLEIDSSHKGEVGALVNGFNLMIQQLKKNQYELAEMERENAWKEMARQVAHEIKNPLTPMKLAVQQLVIAYKDKSHKFDSIFDKVSKTIIGQIDTLSNIASEFSSFARMPKLKLERFNSLNVIEEAVNLFVEEKVNIKIVKNSEEFPVDADKDQLKRTMINMIRNSIQAKADNVEIEIDKNETDVVIRIKDNGKGIPEDVLHKVFEPNFTTKEKGMGLGLKLAKKFLETLNGSISIEESTSAGTIVAIRIPQAKV